jgi:hypothetical protein
MITRIKKLIDTIAFGNETKFAELCHISQANMNRQMAGTRKLSLDTVVNILKNVPNLSADWLMLGIGSMYRNENNDSLLIDTIRTLTDTINEKSKTIDALKKEIEELKR